MQTGLANQFQIQRMGWLHIIVFLSGIAGLGYQILWVRMLSTAVGHEVFAVLAILAAFFGGLAFGALLLDRRIAHSQHPGLWYFGLEMMIGLWAIALIWLRPLMEVAIIAFLGPEPSELLRWTVIFSATLILLLPATMAMGATLPAAERIWAGATGSDRGVGGLYAANTAGAMTGALGTMLVVAPAIGFTSTLLVFAALNILCAVCVLVARNVEGRSAKMLGEPERGLLWVLGLTGFLGIGFEVAAVRALAQILENTVYAFASALAVYLFGTALGAALRQTRVLRSLSTEWLVYGVAVASLIGTVGVQVVTPLSHFTVSISSGTIGVLLGEIAGASAVLFLPSIAAGALFADLAQRSRRPDGGLGTALAANMLGAACAPIVVGLLLIPQIGVFESLVLISIGYVLIVIWHPTFWNLARFAPIPILGGLVAWLAPPLTNLPDGERLIREVEGAAATVTVSQTEDGALWQRVNNSQVMGGTASYRLDRLQGHLILLQHPSPKRALFLGVGTGATLASAAAHADLEAVGVELLSSVLDTAPDFAKAHAEISAHSRLRMTVADARRWARSDPTSYDVIIADTYHPAKDGVAMLYTVEHFHAIRSRLTKDGVFAQWLPLHQLDLPTLRTIIRTFRSAFPDARLHVGNFNLSTPLLVLIAQKEGALPQLKATLGPRINSELGTAISEVGLTSPFELFGGFLGGPSELESFAGFGPINTDDLPVVMFEAPRSLYVPMDPPIDRLREIIRSMHPKPNEAVSMDGISGANAFADRLQRYWQARDMFLRIGTQIQLSGNPAQDAKALAPELIGILRVSPDFGPAYAPLLQMVRRLAPSEPNAAITLLAALERANPTRTEARQLRRELFGG